LLKNNGGIKTNYKEAIETYINGNISVFENWLKRSSKKDMLKALNYYQEEFTNRGGDNKNMLLIMLLYLGESSLI